MENGPMLTKLFLTSFSSLVLAEVAVFLVIRTMSA